MPPASAELLPHPASACDAIRRFGASVEFAAPPDELRMSFRIEGAIERLRLPGPGSALRADGLWHHSCFEAFLGTDADDSYHEFNFAPSGDWAAYRFAARREGRQSPGMPAPRMEFRRDGGYLRIERRDRPRRICRISHRRGPCRPASPP